MDHQRQHSPRGNAPRSGGSAASGKHGKVGKAGGGAGGKKPIKVVYISNPMRVKTSAAGFRALVQELTGRHADPSKYSPDDFDGADDDGAAQELRPEGGAAASPGTGAAGPVAAAGQPDVVAAAFGEGEDGDEEDIFRLQLLDNSYSVFSPPTLLYDLPHDSKVQ